MTTINLIMAIGFGWTSGSAIFALYLLMLWMQKFPQTSLWRRTIALIVIVAVPIGILTMASALYQQGLNKHLVILIELLTATIAFTLSMHALKKGTLKKTIESRDRSA